MREAGFTLLELIVALAVLGLLAALVIMRGPPVSHALELHSVVAEIAAGLRTTRQYAITTDQPAEYTIDLVRRTAHDAEGAAVQLPTGIGVTVLTAAGEVRSAETVGIRFEPDGSSTGGRIVLADGGRRVGIDVGWLTGRVSVTHAP